MIADTFREAADAECRPTVCLNTFDDVHTVSIAV